jgi:drug/metabolite transporter (DMT)-like permease
MSRLLLGLLAAFGAAGLYSAGIALQALEARRVATEHALRFGLLRRLIRRPRWLLGIVLDLGGWALQALALTLAPLTLVQPALAAGLVFLLVIGAAWLHEPVGRREVAAVLAIATGVGAIGWATPAHHSHHDTGTALAVALCLLAALALLPHVLSRLGRQLGVLVAVGAGLAFSWDGLATKFFADDLSQRAFPWVLFWLAGMVTAAAFGSLAENSALQTRPVTQVAPLIFATTTLVPVVLAPFVAGESWPGNPLVQATLVASLVLVIGAAVALARSQAVAAVLRAEATSEERRTGRRPRPWSRLARRPTAATAEGDPDSSVITTIAPGRRSSSRAGG